MIFRSIGLSGFIILLAACGGGSSGGSETEGITVTFSTVQQQARSSSDSLPKIAAGQKTFINSEGAEITLDKAYLTIWSVELEKDCTTSRFTNLPTNLLHWLMPAANAHAVESPTRISTPNILNLSTADQIATVIGTITPPPGDYCGITVELFPADDDAAGLPDTINMIGRTLYLQGTYQTTGNNPEPFEISLGTKAQEKGLALTSLLTLDSNQLRAGLTLVVQYDQWFDSLDLTQLNEHHTQNQLLTNIRESLSIK